MEKKKIILVILVAVLAIVGFGIKVWDKENQEEVVLDSDKFSQDYTKVSEDNVYVFRTIDEITKILENGTGVVFLGFPECPWCQSYVVYLNEVAKEVGVEKIYYYNILEDRKENTAEYQKIVSLLSDYLQYDEEGNKRVYVPAVIFVKNGEIVGFDDETSLDTKGFDTPEEYWTEDEVDDLKSRLKDAMENVKVKACTDCNLE